MTTATTMTNKPGGAEDRNHDKAAGRVLLPNHLIPLRYDLSIQPDFQNFRFLGIVDITFQVHSTTNSTTTTTTNNNKDDPSYMFQSSHEILLHAKELMFESAEYTIGSMKDNNNKNSTPTPTEIPEGQKAESIVVNMKTTTVKFIFTNPIPLESMDTMKLSIHYTGFLNNQMAGFYRSSYTNIYNQKKIMASTQFEALDARRAFPCIDEPAVKAIFGLTLIIPNTYQCCSNMPESNVTTMKPPTLLSSAESTTTNSTSNGIVWKKVSYLDTPKMSTYLLAFCVGEFDCVQKQSMHGVMIKVYTPPGKASTGQFALDCASKALDAYNDFFGIQYPLPKLDMIAIPEFAAGAMENWGLVTYREVDLLIDPITASNQQKQRVATVVTHELAHQWFGNLVTMAWWDDLWLNEGFASWCENWASDQLYPQYRMWDQFTTGHLTSAMRLDALQSSHPIQVPIHHAEEVEQVFDAISYCKGASVVRMIQAVIGMKNFQTGLRNYMNKYAYGNTETFHLWDAWEEASQMPIGEMMGSWTTQMGFPLVSVIKEEWHDDKVILEVEQQWFLSDGSEPDEQGKAKKWTIPILTCTETGAQADMTLMREKTATITVPLSDAGSWVKLNAQQEVPMRVRPGPEMLKRFGMGIKNKTMKAVDRAGVLSDSYALVKAGKFPPQALIELLAYYSDEDDYIVWESLSDVLSGLDSIMSEDDALSTNLKAFARGIVLKLMNKVGWESMESDGHLTTLLRGIMINLLSTFAYDDETVSKEALARFKAFQADPLDVKTLPTDMRPQVLKIVLKNGGAKEYQEIKSYFYSASDNAERKHVLNSLGSIVDAKLKKDTLDWSLSGDIKLQDFFYAMGSVGRSSKEGREISWKFYQENFSKIKKMLEKANPSLMDACIVTCSGSFANNKAADEIEAFFQLNPLPKSTRKIAQTLESIRTNAKLLMMIQASDLSKAEYWTAL